MTQSSMMIKIVGPGGQMKRITIDFDGEARFVEHAGDHVVTILDATRVHQTDDFAEE